MRPGVLVRPRSRRNKRRWLSKKGSGRRRRQPMRRPRGSIARSAGAWRRRISATWRPIWRLLLLQRRRDGSRRSSPPARRRPCTQRRNTAAHVCRRQRTGARTGPPRTAGLAAARLGGATSWRAARARARNGCHCTMGGIIALAKTSKTELNWIVTKLTRPR